MQTHERTKIWDKNRCFAEAAVHITYMVFLGHSFPESQICFLRYFFKRKVINTNVYSWCLFTAQAYTADMLTCVEQFKVLLLRFDITRLCHRAASRWWAISGSVSRVQWTVWESVNSRALGLFFVFPGFWIILDKNRWNRFFKGMFYLSCFFLAPKCFRYTSADMQKIWTVFDIVYMNYFQVVPIRWLSNSNTSVKIVFVRYRITTNFDYLWTGNFLNPSCPGFLA